MCVCGEVNYVCVYICVNSVCQCIEFSLREDLRSTRAIHHYYYYVKPKWTATASSVVILLLIHPTSLALHELRPEVTPCGCSVSSVLSLDRLGRRGDMENDSAENVF